MTDVFSLFLISFFKQSEKRIAVPGPGRRAHGPVNARALSWLGIFGGEFVHILMFIFIFWQVLKVFDRGNRKLLFWYVKWMRGRSPVLRDFGWNETLFADSQFQSEISFGWNIKSFSLKRFRGKIEARSLDLTGMFVKSQFVMSWRMKMPGMSSSGWCLMEHSIERDWMAPVFGHRSGHHN